MRIKFIGKKNNKNIGQKLKGNKEKAMIKLVAVDMDGTFLNGQKEYNKKRFMAIYETMKERDIKFVVASGNQYYQLKSFFSEIASEISFVAENGALIISENEEPFCGEMTEVLVDKMLNFFEKDPKIQTIMCGRKSAYTSQKETSTFIEGGRKYYHKLEVVDKLSSEIDDIIFKFALNVPREETENYMEMFNTQFQNEVVAVSSGNGAIDLIIPGLHKANGLQLLQDRWQIEAEHMATFGDGGNDLEMLKHAKHSYAMKNASKKVKEVANFEAPSNEDEGVLVVLEELIK